MRRGTGVALAAAGVVLGLVAGTMGIASATTASTATTATATGPGGFGGPGGHGGRGMMGGGADLAQVVAKLTGLTVQDVMTKRAAGASFAEIAKSKGVSSATVVSTALDDAKQMFDAAVKTGRMTSDQETQALADLKTRLATEIASTEALPQRGGPGGRGRGGELASSVASMTGMSVTDVMTQRQSGKSFAEIAKAKGVSVSQLISDAVKKATANLTERFTAEADSTSAVGPDGSRGLDGPPASGGATTTAPPAMN